MELDIKIDNDKENKFMKRREIEATAAYAGSTPTRDVVKQELCKKLSLNPDATAVVRIGQVYGSTSSHIILHSYKTREAMLALEKEGMKKNVKAAEAKNAEAKKEKVPGKEAEAKSEGKKEEAEKKVKKEEKAEAKEATK